MTLTAAVLMFALSQKAQPPVKHIVFDEDELIVERERPVGEYIDAPPTTKFRNLIKIRQNFADKILKSVDQM